MKRLICFYLEEAGVQVEFCVKCNADAYLRTLVLYSSRLMILPNTTIVAHIRSSV